MNKAIIAGAVGGTLLGWVFNFVVNPIADKTDNQLVLFPFAVLQVAMPSIAGILVYRSFR